MNGVCQHYSLLTNLMTCVSSEKGGAPFYYFYRSKGEFDDPRFDASPHAPGRELRASPPVYSPPSFLRLSVPELYGRGEKMNSLVSPGNHHKKKMLYSRYGRYHCIQRYRFLRRTTRTDTLLNDLRNRERERRDSFFDN